MAFSLDCNVLEEIRPNHIKVGDELNFKATNLDLTPFHLTDINKKWKVISVVPSLDTGVCESQTRKFNKDLKNHNDVQLITISRDTVFASNRVCESFLEGSHKIVSDYNYRDFGETTGLLFEDVQLLCRSVIILDENNKVGYIQIANPVTDEPDYDAAIKFLAENS